MAKPSMQAHDHLRKMDSEKEQEQKRVKETLINEPLIRVSISPMYRKRLGANLPLTIGVETVTVPVDGQVYEIKESFGEVLKAHLSQIDKEEIRSEGKWRGNQGDVYPTGPIPGKT
jgi:hypothetical protein